MIVVTGATGATGSLVAAALSARGFAWRAFVRDPDRLRVSGSDGVFAGRYEEPDTLKRACRCARALFLLSKPGPEQVHLESLAIAAAARAGVTRLVRMSVMAADPAAPSAVRRWHGEAEAAATKAGIPVASLRANFFMQNFLPFGRSVGAKGEFSLPAGAARVSVVDLRDIADCAANLLTNPDFEARNWTLTGPQSLSFGEAADLLAKVRGAPVIYRPGDLAAFERRLIEAGNPAWRAEALGYLYRDFQAGLNAPVSGDIDVILGRPARSLRSYFIENAGFFAAKAG